MVTIPHSVSKILFTEHNLLQLSIIVSCRRQYQRIQILEYKRWRFDSWNSCHRSSCFSLSRLNSLWHWCCNISGSEWFSCFHYCHQKRKEFFSLLQVVHLIKSKRRKTFRIIENSKRQFQHSSLFSRECWKTVFLYVMCTYTIFTCV